MSESHFPRPHARGKGAGGRGLPGQGQGTREGARLARRRIARSPTSHRPWACRSHRCPSGSATSRSHPRSGCAGRTGARIPRTKQSSARSRSSTAKEGSASAALSDEAFFVAGVALYAGEGSKTDGEVRFSNSDPEMVRLFCAWFRHFFAIDEQRLRGRIYLHHGLDLSAAEEFWSVVAHIPTTQFHKTYRAVPDPSIRRNKHQHGCFSVGYGCSRTHREVMGLVRALLSSEALPG